MIGLRAGSATDVGLVRTNNQDHLLVADPLFAVADGMGGAAAGEVASATAVEGLLQAFSGIEAPTAEALVGAARAANQAVWEKAEANPAMRGMGTTLVAVALLPDSRLAAVNVGDSRLYVLHEGQLRQITSDHNVVAELVAEGRISPEQAEVHPHRNIMTRALGVEPDVEVDLFMEDPVPGDRYLLCSDGLPRELNDYQIASLLLRLADPGEAAKELVGEAKRRGGNDNITVVVVDITDSELADAGLAESDIADADIADSDIAAALPLAAQPSEEPQELASTPKAKSKPKSKSKAKSKLITVRVVAFFVLLLVILGGGAAALAWYARSAYFVGLQGNRITIFQGRPDGVLWFHPTVARRTALTTADVLPHNLSKLQSGQEEPTLAAADQYVTNLGAEATAARTAQAATTTTPTTAPPATTPTTAGPAPPPTT